MEHTVFLICTTLAAISVSMITLTLLAIALGKVGGSRASSFPQTSGEMPKEDHESGSQEAA